MPHRSASFSIFAPGSRSNMQEDWLGAVESFRQFRPGLDIVLTHVDDRFDTGMKDSIGADAAPRAAASRQALVLVPD